MNRLMEYDIDKLEISKGIKDETKKGLLEKGRLIKKNKKDIVFNEKEKIDKVYFVIEGNVSVFKINENGERKIIFILRQGQMINDIFTPSQISTSIGCESFDKSLILEYKLVDFISLMEKDFELTKNIIMYMERRTRRLYRQLKNAISIKVEKKLAAKLYKLSREFGVNKGVWTLIDVDLTITYLADMLGCKRETVSRAMKILQDENLVSIKDKKIYIKKEEIVLYFKGKSL